MTQEQIKGIIPHRDPFLFLDEITELIPGKKAVGLKTFPRNFFVFDGHFPENPVLPGVIISEAMAQAGAVCMLCLPQFKGKIGFLGGLDKVRFKRMVLPGETLRMEVEIVKTRGPMGVGKARAYVGEELACRGEITFAIK